MIDKFQNQENVEYFWQIPRRWTWDVIIKTTGNRL